MILRNFQDLFWIGFQKRIEGWFFGIWSWQIGILCPTLKPEEPKRLKYWMIAIDPEFPDEEGPELFSIVPLISQVIFKQGGYMFRV